MQPALLWFDFILMLPIEIQRVWRLRVTGTTIVYFLMRHVAIVAYALFLAESIVSTTNEKVRASLPVCLLQALMRNLGMW